VGVALAACGDQPYTLETPEGIAGGKSLRYQKGVLTLQEACFEGEGVAFEAKTLRFDKKTGELVAINPKGTFFDWRFTADRLLAREGTVVFAAPRFSREGVTVQAERAEATSGTVRLENLQAEAYGYRFRAQNGTLTEDRFVAYALFATPCQKGEALALLGERAVFDLKRKRLLVEESRVRYYGLCLARPKSLLLDLAKPLKLRSPFVFSFSDGLTVGVQNLPLWEPGVPLGQERTRLTAVLESLGGTAPKLRLGFSRPEASFSATLGTEAFSLALDTRDVRVVVLEVGRGYLELAPRFTLKNWTLAPYGAVYTSADTSEAYAGVWVKARFAGSLAEGRYTVQPRLRLAAGTGETLWAAYGGRATWRRGALSFSLSGTGRIGGGENDFPSLRDTEQLAAELRYGAARAYYRYDFGGESGRLGISYRGAFWAQVEKGLGTLSNRTELVAGLPKPRPSPGGIALAPELGYDFGLGRFSRVGLTLAYNDGCLIYQLRARYILEPWLGEAAGLNLSMGVALP